MIEKECNIKNVAGMHARPATLFVELASKSKCHVVVKKDEIEVNGKSILGVMMLCASSGEKIVISAKGESLEEEEKIINDLSNLIDNYFYEEPAQA